MDYDEEVVCIGDLHKKNLSGRRTWNLRRFALIGITMVYYKQGVKRGEWDIGGCTIRKMTPEECHEPAAKFAFCLEGIKKCYIFSANSEKNREKWITILTEQIEEYKTVSRRFVRRGEVIVGAGFLKKKIMLGRSQSMLIATNFPRIIVIDPSTSLLKDQINWIRGQSQYIKVWWSTIILTLLIMARRWTRPNLSCPFKTGNMPLKILTMACCIGKMFLE
jgi:hypothetical protein